MCTLQGGGIQAGIVVRKKIMSTSSCRHSLAMVLNRSILQCTIEEFRKMNVDEQRNA